MNSASSQKGAEFMLICMMDGFSTQKFCKFTAFTAFVKLCQSSGFTQAVQNTGFVQLSNFFESAFLIMGILILTFVFTCGFEICINHSKYSLEL
ncbi:sodium potassium-transporting atpase subunit beta-1-interacting protein isoform x2 [Lasius niger]|uniref:Sodium potassium-transporting atpase subunit beta-1-interacting protein isoform x2 n=1 Tax=Lasius niger TaxID=67767 RepID=A0A0J7KQV4_LASNI|nr:sodium potassium-transporting atpase subunit beta-1-interacting protein isoform x2 [Lasius niger]